MKLTPQLFRFRRSQYVGLRATPISGPSFISRRMPLRTMASSTPPDASTQPDKNPQSSSANTQDPSDQTEHKQNQDAAAPLPLPAPSNESTTLDMSNGSTTVKLDHLGPLVVNKDGTLSRINNWGEMSEIERRNTVRVLGKRNMLRREALMGEEGK